MNATVEAAWIAAGVGGAGIVATALTAIITARSSAKSAEATANAASASSAAALDAAHDAWLRDKRDETYRVLFGAIARRGQIMFNVRKLGEGGSNLGQSAGHLLDPIAQDVTQFGQEMNASLTGLMAGLMAYGSGQQLEERLRSVNDGWDAFGRAMVGWVDAHAQPPGPALDADTDRAFRLVIDTAKTLEEADSKLSAALSQDLTQRPSQRTDGKQ
jgi:hypothetical protein